MTGGRYAYYAALKGSALAQAGRRAEAEAELADLDRRSRSGEFVPSLCRAFVLAPLGEREAALGALEKAYSERNAFLWLQIHLGHFDGLKGDPRYQALAAKLARTAPTTVARSASGSGR